MQPRLTTQASPAALVEDDLVGRPARGEAQLDGPDPVRRVVRRPLLEERLAGGAVDEPLQGHRPAAGAAQRALGDREVIRDQVHLREAGLGEIDLVRVRDRDLAAADLEDLLLAGHGAMLAADRKEVAADGGDPPGSDPAADRPRTPVCPARDSGRRTADDGGRARDAHRCSASPSPPASSSPTSPATPASSPAPSSTTRRTSWPTSSGPSSAPSGRPSSSPSSKATPPSSTSITEAVDGGAAPGHHRAVLLRLPAPPPRHPPGVELRMQRLHPRPEPRPEGRRPPRPGHPPADRRSWEELVGSDVIVVHRLLKNHVARRRSTPTRCTPPPASRRWASTTRPRPGLVEHREDVRGRRRGRRLAPRPPGCLGGRARPGSRRRRAKRTRPDLRAGPRRPARARLGLPDVAAPPPRNGSTRSPGSRRSPGRPGDAASASSTTACTARTRSSRRSSTGTRTTTYAALAVPDPGRARSS